MTVHQLLSQRVAAALAAVGASDAAPIIQGAARPEFGDYQANGVMGAAKALKTNPRELAAKVVAALDLDGIASKIEIAGPGFINIGLADSFLAQTLAEQQADPRLGCATDHPLTVVVDYSSPNLAKEMHVGHLRSTIIGDALARVLQHLGHTVIRQNHVGDWGTQFGMLIAFLLDSGGDSNELALNDLEGFYRAAKQRFNSDADFADRARDYVVKLQGGDATVLGFWQRFLDVSLKHCEAVYAELGVQLTRADVRGESAYNDDLPRVVADLDAKGLLSEDQGTLLVMTEEFRNREGATLGYIVQKQDGGYLYATSDLAALRYRSSTLGAQRILYVVDARQGLHFQQLFSVARRAGFVGSDASLEHIAFGTMMDENGKPFSTRDGGTVKLIDLLDEAKKRAFDLVSSKNPDLPESRRHAIAQAVGIGAVKYADLSKHRTSDYVFDWNTMLSFDGNNAPYLQLAYTRVASIFRQAGSFDVQAPIVIGDPAEHALALALVQFPDVLRQVADEACPHFLCAYLYQLATRFSRFYDACPVLKASAEWRASRLALCAATAKTMSTGLGLLGIATLEEM